MLLREMMWGVKTGRTLYGVALERALVEMNLWQNGYRLDPQGFPVEKMIATDLVKSLDERTKRELQWCFGYQLYTLGA